MTKTAWLPVLAWLLMQTPSAPQTPYFAESRGARVPVPAGWTFNDRLIAAAGPIDMTSFGGHYVQGGLPPPGGAEIEVTSVPMPPSLTGYIQKELAGPQVEPLQEVAEPQNPGIRAAYTESVNADASLHTVAEYIPHGSTLYKFYLTYWSGDPNEAAMNAILINMVRGARLR